MSGLYAGIKFSKAGDASDAASGARNGGAAHATTTGETGATGGGDAARLEAEAAKYAAQQAEQAAKDQAEAQRKAALAFGPVRRKPNAAARPKPANVFASASTGSNIASPSSSTVAPPSFFPSTVASTSAVFISAPPAAATAAESGSGHVLTGRTLIVPPSMTLDEEDINGFKGTAAGKKAANKAKKRNKKNKSKEDDPALAWDAEYDPARPTDYNEYKVYSKIARAERRSKLRREKERQRRAERSINDSGQSSDYTDSDEDSDEERRRRMAKANNRFFAPPKNYDEIANTGEASAEGNAALAAAMKAAASMPIDVDDDSNDDEDLYPASAHVNPLPEQSDARSLGVESRNEPAEPVIVTEAAPDEWAAWSAVTQADDDPYSRRMALSRGEAASMPARQPLPSNSAIQQPPVVRPLPPAAQPTSLASPANVPSFFSGPNGESIPLPPPPAFNSLSPIPGLGLPAAAAPTVVGEPVAPVTSTGTVVDITEAQAKARAIAARLASLNKLGSGASSASPAQGSLSPSTHTTDPIPGLGGTPGPTQPDTAPKEAVKPQDFAKSLMAKYGWTKGQGLGTTSQGIVNPLALSNASEGKKGKGKQADSSHAQGNTKVLGMATAKGRVTSEIKTERDKAERERYGEPSRVVCLSNMVGRAEVDAELSDDVGQEAKKLGVLEQCSVHVMPPYVADEDSVRVFLVYSGLVGAWKAVKEFDGRFFGGRTVKAKFYSEVAFDNDALHL